MRVMCFLPLAMIAIQPAFAWTVEKTQGEVSIQQKKKTTPLAVGTELKAGDVLITGTNGRVLLKDDESMLWIGSATNFKVHKLADVDNDVMGRLDVIKGKIRAKFKRPSGPQAYPYEVKARSVVAGVRGTEFFIAVDGSEDRVCTLEGLVRVTSVKTSAESWDVASGHGLFVKPNEMPKVRETTPEQAKTWTDATSI